MRMMPSSAVSASGASVTIRAVRTGPSSRMRDSATAGPSSLGTELPQRVIPLEGEYQSHVKPAVRTMTVSDLTPMKWTCFHNVPEFVMGGPPRSHTATAKNAPIRPRPRSSRSAFAPSHSAAPNSISTPVRFSVHVPINRLLFRASRASRRILAVPRKPRFVDWNLQWRNRMVPRRSASVRLDHALALAGVSGAGEPPGAPGGKGSLDGGGRVRLAGLRPETTPVERIAGNPEPAPPAPVAGGTGVVGTSGTSADPPDNASAFPDQPLLRGPAMRGNRGIGLLGAGEKEKPPPDIADPIEAVNRGIF